MDIKQSSGTPQQRHSRKLVTGQSGIFIVPLIPCHDSSFRAQDVSPGFLAIPTEIGMSGMERIYQIDQILAGRKFVPRVELQERLGVSWATLKRDLNYLKDRLNAPSSSIASWAATGSRQRGNVSGHSMSYLAFGSPLRKFMRS
jgi:hypothetical protein